MLRVLRSTELSMSNLVSSDHLTIMEHMPGRPGDTAKSMGRKKAAF